MEPSKKSAVLTMQPTMTVLLEFELIAVGQIVALEVSLNVTFAKILCLLKEKTQERFKPIFEFSESTCFYHPQQHCFLDLNRRVEEASLPQGSRLFVL